MEKKRLKELVEDPAQLAKVLDNLETLFDADEFKMYEPENHDVMSVIKRPKREVLKPSGIIDPNTGKETTTLTHEDVVRVPLSLQKLIVKRATVFLTGAPPELEANPQGDAEEQLLEMVKKVWEDNKLDYKNMPIAETMMSQKEVCEIWFMADTDPDYWGELAPAGSQRPRMIVVKPIDGSLFYPLFDGMRDLVGFARVFPVKDEQGQEKKYIDVYTDDFIYEFEQTKTGAELREPQEGQQNPYPNPYGKIPVIYYQQPRAEWMDVQAAIARLEELLSNHGDINDYNGSPTIISEGEILSFASKGEKGKILEVDKGGKVSYLSWDAAPESIRMEIDNLWEVIYTHTQTADISFQQVKSLSNVSGIAIKLMFLDAHSKAKEKQSSVFGECLQRRINLIKAACVAVNPDLKSAYRLHIKPVFFDYMPINDKEVAETNEITVRTLKDANGGLPIVDHKTSIENGPYDLESPDDTQEAIENRMQEEALAGNIV